ncbi:MAG TPA: CDP-alcohol phosphatidyltransferase family protein [Candidatus Acidoferrales bacterium]|nr:CDP-alcohol phosphatidyltransferase family protein [Candidatus Acidoferrales bacterium]
MRIENFARPFRRILDRAVALLAKARIPASLLTLTGFAFCLAAAVFFGLGRFTAAGIAMIPAAVCDLLARPLARRQPQISLFTAFLKSVLHRYADLAVFLGLLVYYSTVNRFWLALLTGIALAGAVMVSYSQARAESLIDRCRVGFWDRPERLGLLILGAVFGRVPIALLILAIGPNVTVVHRIWHTWKETEGRRAAAEGNVSAAQTSDSKSSQSAQPAAQHEMTELIARTARRGA